MRHHGRVSVPFFTGGDAVTRLAHQTHNFRTTLAEIVIRVHEDLARTCCERFVGVVAEFLVAEKDDLVIKPRLADLGDRVVVDPVGNADAIDLGAECAGQWLYGYALERAHGAVPISLRWVAVAPDGSDRQCKDTLRVRSKFAGRRAVHATDD
ncbi:MAG: hypothetical protein ACI9DC_002826 [Gammaproteobacteria bacterium]